MASYPLQQIPVVPSSEWLRIVNKQSNQSSQYSGSQTIIQFFASWTLAINWPRMSVAEAEVLTAWLDSLQGSYGSFYYTPCRSVYPNANTLTLASAAFPSTQTVQLVGWTASAATNLRVGQYIQLGTQLVRIAATPINADSSGRAVIEFNPPLRANLAAGSAVVTNAPKGIFRLDQSNGSGFQLDPDLTPEFDSLTAIEVI
jgi:hypothetical protein